MAVAPGWLFTSKLRLLQRHSKDSATFFVADGNADASHDAPMTAITPFYLRAPLQMELMMLIALILICSAAATPDLRDCTRENAVSVMRVPASFGNPVTCFMHGQSYLAETSIGQELDDNDRIKIVCTAVKP